MNDDVIVQKSDSNKIVIRFAMESTPNECDVTVVLSRADKQKSLEMVRTIAENLFFACHPEMKV